VIGVSQVSVRYTRIDREYEACLAELGDLLAEPQPGDVKKVPPGLLEPRRFIEELYSIVYDCIEQLIPPPHVYWFRQESKLLTCMQSAGLPITGIGPNVAESIFTAVQACSENIIAEFEKSKNVNDIREREKVYRQVVIKCVRPAIKCEYDVDAEFGFAQAYGWLKV
jgi:hypothetical protein